jgi:hypothetical protein
MGLFSLRVISHFGFGLIFAAILEGLESIKVDRPFDCG